MLMGFQSSNASCLPQRRGEPSLPAKIVEPGVCPEGWRFASPTVSRKNNGEGSCGRVCQEGFAWVSLYSVGFRTTRFTDGMLHPKTMRHQCFLAALMIVSSVILIVLSNSFTECCYILPISAWMLAVFVCHTICTQSTLHAHVRQH